ncbi:MAG TPA: TetR family transcriptional regulator [Nonomuraea sp.]|nr:TetR family transcriptional regulator [Nonomuraea sp.]
MSIDTLGLREQKKRETRQAISDHATQLFLERGFDRTTIADIAAAARVARMTVTNYFPRKEDLAFDQHVAFVAGLAEAVAGREPGESALEAVRRAYLAALDRRDPVIGFGGRDVARMVADSPTLVARLRDLHDQREQALAAHLIAEPPTPQEVPTPQETSTSSQEAPTARPATSQEPRPAAGDERDRIAAAAVAAQLAAADRLLLREAQRRTLAGEPADAVATALAETARQVFALLEPAIGNHARR